MDACGKVLLLDHIITHFREFIGEFLNAIESSNDDVRIGGRHGRIVVGAANQIVTSSNAGGRILAGNN
jgi:hypothetical protein